jgi:hypothetical protein
VLFGYIHTLEAVSDRESRDWRSRSRSPWYETGHQEFWFDREAQRFMLLGRFDADGDVWTVNQTTANASRLPISQPTGEPAPHPTTGNIVDAFPTGPAPNAYADLISARSGHLASGE